MRIKTEILIILTFSLFSCNSKSIKTCNYNLNQLFKDSIPVWIVYQNDTLKEFRDLGRNSVSYGTYIFDKNNNLRFYAFIIENNKYYYSEQFDSLGHLIKREGSPLLEYRIFKGGKDTIIFNGSLFSLNKKYQEITIISNKYDTISPQFLFKNEFYSNVKSFGFKLPISSRNDSLVFYTHVVYKDTCLGKIEEFIDTTLFRNFRF